MIKRQKCPVCKKELPSETPDAFPFCGDRCRKVDFFRWCDGRYAIVEDLDPMVARFMAEEQQTGSQDVDPG